MVLRDFNFPCFNFITYVERQTTLGGASPVFCEELKTCNRFPVHWSVVLVEALTDGQANEASLRQKSSDLINVFDSRRGIKTAQAYSIIVLQI